MLCLKPTNLVGVYYIYFTLQSLKPQTKQEIKTIIIYVREDRKI